MLIILGRDILLHPYRRPSPVFFSLIGPRRATKRRFVTRWIRGVLPALLISRGDRKSLLAYPILTPPQFTSATPTQSLLPLREFMWLYTRKHSVGCLGLSGVVISG